MSRILMPFIKKRIAVDYALEIFVITNEDIYGESKYLFDPVMDRFSKRHLILFRVAENDITTLQVGHDIAEIQRLVERLKI